MGGLAKKQTTVASLKEELQNVSIAVVADYRGLTVADLTELRRKFHQVNAKFTVMKNTLARRAVEGTDVSVLSEALKGPTALLIGYEDQVAPVKVLKDFLKAGKKDNPIRGGYLEGKFLTAAEVDQLASLPPLNELRAKLLGGIASPLNGLVGALASQQRSLVYVLDQLAKQKQGA